MTETSPVRRSYWPIILIAFILIVQALFFMGASLEQSEAVLLSDDSQRWPKTLYDLAGIFRQSLTSPLLVWLVACFCLGSFMVTHDIQRCETLPKTSLWTGLLFTITSAVYVIIIAGQVSVDNMIILRLFGLAVLCWSARTIFKLIDNK